MRVPRPPEAKRSRSQKAPGSTTGGAAATGFSLPLGQRTRYVLAALALLSMVASGVFSLASAMARRSVDLAYKIDPSNPVIAARFALSEVSNPIQSNSPTNFREVASRALAQDPTAADAAVAIGISSQLDSEAALANKAFAYALMLSRRETRAHIWAIEQAVSVGDIRLALQHYNLAIKTSNSAENILFPNLMNAAKEQLVRSELTRLIATNPQWRDRFLSFSAENSARPEYIASLFLAIENNGTRIDKSVLAELVNNLYSKDLGDKAWKYYNSEINNSPGLIRKFRGGRAGLTNFDWRTETPVGILPTVIRSGDEYVLEVSKVPSSSGTVANQALRLSPGSYRLAGSFDAPQGTDRSAYRWEIACTDRQPFATVDLSEGQGSQSYSKAFTVPADCPQQTLTLVARQSSGFQAQNTSFSSPTITRIGAKAD